jgi:hypothetical protein
MVADADRLIAQPVPGLGLGPDCVRPSRIAGPPSETGQERVQAPVKPRDAIENPLEPLPGPAEGLRLRLSDLLLDARQAISPAPVTVAGGPDEVVPSHLHGSPLVRR